MFKGKNSLSTSIFRHALLSGPMATGERGGSRYVSVEFDRAIRLSSLVFHKVFHSVVERKLKP